MSDINEHEIKQLGMDCLVMLLRKVNLQFTVTYRFKHYSYNQEECIIRIPTIGSFTTKGEDSLQLSIKKAIVALINTYELFSNLRESVNDIIKKQNAPKPCEPVSFDSLVPKSNQVKFQPPTLV